MSRNSAVLTCEQCSALFQRVPFSQARLIVLFCGEAEPREVAAGFSLVAGSLQSTDGAAVGPRIVLVLPAGTETGSVEEVRSRLLERLRSFGEQRSNALAAWVLALAPRLRVVLMEDCDTEQLVEWARTVEPASVVLVLEAGRLASRLVSARPSTGAELAEDHWLPQLEHAATALAKVAGERELHITLWTGFLLPSTQADVDRLLDIEGCGVLSIDSDQVTRSRQLLSLARGGRLKEALRLCDEQINEPFARDLMKAQCLQAAGQLPLGYTYLAPHRERILSDGEPECLLLAAQLAMLHGQSADGEAYVRRAVELPLTEEPHLSLALSLARVLNANALSESIRERLWAMHPKSHVSLLEQARAYQQEARYADMVHLLSEVVEREACPSSLKWLWTLARHHVDGPLDPDRLLEEVRKNLPEELEGTTLFCAQAALQAGHPERSLARVMAFAWSEARWSEAARLLLDAVARLLLASPEQVKEMEPRLLPEALDYALRYLSGHPADVAMRRHLLQLVDPERSGFMLFTLLSALVLKHCPSWAEVKPIPARDYSGLLSQEQMHGIFEAFFKAIPEQRLPTGEVGRAMVMGQGDVRLEDLPCPPDQVLNGFMRMFNDAAGALTASQLNQIHPLLYCTLILARVTGRFADGVRAREIFAGMLCIAGDFRQARDIIETLLRGMRVQEPAPHKRRAWIAFAEFGQRAKSLPEALLGLLCASMCAPGEEDEDDVFNDIRLWIRILRDLRFHDKALELIAEARVLLQRFGREERNAHKLDHLEASIRFLSLADVLGTTEEEARIQELGALLVRANTQALATDGDFQPGALLLAHLVSLLRKRGLSLPKSMQAEVDAQLARVEGLFAPFVQTVAGRGSTVELLKTLGSEMEHVRRGEDLGLAALQVEMLARHALLNVAEAKQVGHTLYLLEWSMDRSLRNVDEAANQTKQSPSLAQKEVVLHWLSQLLNGPAMDPRNAGEVALLGARLESEVLDGQGAHGTRLPPDPNVCERFLSDLSRRGLDVHVLGLDEDSRLIRVSAVDGALSLARESLEVFDREALREWSTAYPAGYVNMDVRDPNGLVEVERTLERMGLHLARVERPSLLISTAELQPIPANLFLLNGVLAGTQCAMASAPSLTWLRSAHAHPRVARGVRAAWIPTTDSPEEQGALGVLRSAAEEPLRAHGLELSCEALAPRSLAGADLAFIGAHGGISPEGMFFRVVADERAARFSARELASRVAGAGVVILAICNGGRVDRNPLARATVGLARLLLDHGCRAVIASPWSLDVSVIQRWLPAFLSRFDAGAPVIEANHAGNQAVMRFSHHPFYSLAMNVVGDPWATR